MQKELNPELFGTSSLNQTRFKEETTSSQRVVHQVDVKIAENQAQIKQITQQMESLVQHVNEFIKTSHHRTEKLYLHLKQAESRFDQFSQESNQKFSMVHARLNERKSMDGKIQEMIDRHNSVIKSYELRLQQLQKVVTEKQAQLVESQAALNETKMEIARLKRL